MELGQNCSLVQISLQCLPWAVDFFSSPPPTRRPASIKLIPWLYSFVHCLYPETVWIHLALYPSRSPMLPLDPMLNSGSEKSLGLYPGTSLISARFFPSLMKGGQALLWSNIFLATVCFLPTTLLHAPGILCSPGHPDVCSLHEVSLLIPRLQNFLFFLSLPAWVSLVTGRQSASWLWCFRVSSLESAIFFLWSLKSFMLKWFLLNKYFYKWSHIYILVDKGSLYILRMKANNKW